MIWTAGDKGRVMDDVVARATVGGGGDSSSTIMLPRTTVYIGDSPTDLACLVKADAGICIRDAAMTGEQRDLQETLERIGVECLHVGGFEDERQVKEGRRRLWWARDFEEVCRSGVVGRLPD